VLWILKHEIILVKDEKIKRCRAEAVLSFSGQLKIVSLLHRVP